MTLITVRNVSQGYTKYMISLHCICFQVLEPFVSAGWSHEDMKTFLNTYKVTGPKLSVFRWEKNVFTLSSDIKTEKSNFKNSVLCKLYCKELFAWLILFLIYATEQNDFFKNATHSVASIYKCAELCFNRNLFFFVWLHKQLMYW